MSLLAVEIFHSADQVLPRLSARCLGGNGGMDPYSSPYMIPNYNPYNPFPHALLSTRESLCLSLSFLAASELLVSCAEGSHTPSLNPKSLR